MKVKVTGIDSNYFTYLERISRLFFTGCNFTDQESEQVALAYHFTLQQSSELFVQLTLTELRTGKRWHGRLERRIESDDREKLEKETKQVLGLCLLQVLQEYTGIQQPWGVLTGIRPTKLFHREIQKGYSFSTVEQRLQSRYEIHPEKTTLLHEIVQQQREAIPDLDDLGKEVSIYIGIPFCPTKCAYCTFPAYSIQGRTGSVREFLTALHEEIAAFGDWMKQKGLSVTTIYFGGGTPTSITATQMDQIFEQCKKFFPSLESVRELTVEAGRPDTLEVDKLEVLKKWHVDRISINPQTFQEQTLKRIGRHHTVEETLNKYHLARDMGLCNINMDLIIGLPNEQINTFQQTLSVIEELRPESLTVHTLSFKRGSHMSQNKEKYRVAGRKEISEMVNIARKRTKEMGYKPYYLYRQTNILGNQENVGYAFPGKESLYNIIIMEEKQTILALGCGAVSKIVHPTTEKITRWANPKEPKAYVKTYRDHIQGKIDELNQVYG